MVTEVLPRIRMKPENGGSLHGSVSALGEAVVALPKSSQRLGWREVCWLLASPHRGAERRICIEMPQLLSAEPLLGAPLQRQSSHLLPQLPLVMSLEGSVDPRDDNDVRAHIIHIIRAACCPATCQQFGRHWTSVHLI